MSIDTDCIEKMILVKNSLYSKSIYRDSYIYVLKFNNNYGAVVYTAKDCCVGNVNLIKFDNDYYWYVVNEPRLSEDHFNSNSKLLRILEEINKL